MLTPKPPNAGPKLGLFLLAADAAAPDVAPTPPNDAPAVALGPPKVAPTLTDSCTVWKEANDIVVRAHDT